MQGKWIEVRDCCFDGLCNSMVGRCLAFGVRQMAICCRTPWVRSTLVALQDDVRPRLNKAGPLRGSLTARTMWPASCKMHQPSIPAQMQPKASLWWTPHVVNPSPRLWAWSRRRLLSSRRRSKKGASKSKRWKEASKQNAGLAWTLCLLLIWTRDKQTPNP